MTEKVRQVTVYLQTPVLLGDESGVGNYEQTLGYIPGSVLRGAIATHILQADAPAFRRVFETSERPPRFGNAYPAWSEVWAYPFPATARTCKQYPGYAAEKHEGHGVFDVLVEQTLYELLSDLRFPCRERLLPAIGAKRLELTSNYEPLCPHKQDKKCGEVKPATGYYVLRSSGPGPAPEPLISRATHVGINRARGVAEDALLFTLETIETVANLQFRGRLVYDDAYEDDLERLIGLRGQSSSFRIARGRSRGMGLVEIQVDVPPSAPDEEIEDRLDLLQREFRQALQAERYAGIEGLAFTPGHFFSLTLRSAAILTEPDSLPSLWPALSPTALAGAWPLRAWARTTLVGGWNAAASLPRCTRQAVEAGAVYLYYMPEEALSRTALVQALTVLEMEGIGAQRERGYGQLAVCAPFHYAGWVNGDTKPTLQAPALKSREAKLIQRAKEAVDGATIASQPEKRLKPAQIQLLLREAQAGYGVEHVLNWLRYQQARVDAWQESRLAERITKDIDALYQEARDDLNQEGVTITKHRLSEKWADLVRQYLAYLLRWYQVAWQRKKEEAHD